PSQWQKVYASVVLSLTLMPQELARKLSFTHPLFTHQLSMRFTTNNASRCVSSTGSIIGQFVTLAPAQWKTRGTCGNLCAYLRGFLTRRKGRALVRKSSPTWNNAPSQTPIPRNHRS